MSIVQSYRSMPSMIFNSFSIILLFFLSYPHLMFLLLIFSFLMGP
jgi:hypothetical protein